MALTRRRLLLVLGGAAAAGAAAHFGLPRPREATRRGSALGTTVAMTASGPDPEGALDAAFAELRAVEEAMSLYRPLSQIRRLNHDGVLHSPHPYLVEVMTQARRLSERSGGAFDVTVQPLWDLCSRETTPSDRDLSAALERVDWRRVAVDRDRIALGPGMAVTLNGIAQGYATDRALAALRSRGVVHAIVDAGEIGAAGRPRTVGIQHPRVPGAWIDLARLEGRCMATSGDYGAASPGGPPLRHLFDPRTGRTPAHFAGVTVVSGSATEADGLSTAVFVAGLERGLGLIEAAGAEALFVFKDGSVKATKGFPRADA